MYNWSFPEENCNNSYTRESSKCWEKRVKENNVQVTNAIYKHCVTNNHPIANISFKIIDQDSKQDAKEAREAMHIRINNPTNEFKW